MIRPNCRHDKSNTPSATCWIISCSAHYEHAVRMNLLEHKDATKSLATETELAAARLEIQKLTADLHDTLMAQRTAFVRCACGRMREKGVRCRGCKT